MKLTLTEFEAGPGSNSHQYRQVLIDSGVPAALAQEATRIRFAGEAQNESERQVLIAVAQLLLRRVQ